MPSGLPIVYEDRDVLVIDKPPGLITASGPRDKRVTLVQMVEGYLAATAPGARFGLIHRLDKDARGLLVFSKNAPAYHHLKEQFYHHTVERVYTAIVVGRPDTPLPDQTRFTIRSNLVERKDGSVHSVDPARTRGDRGQPAVTHVEIIAHAPPTPSLPRGLSLLRITLETGRKHQIRVHLSERHTPILGDPTYAQPPYDRPPLYLMASRLAFETESAGRLEFELPLPPAFRKLVRPPEGGPPAPDSQPATSSEPSATLADQQPPVAPKVTTPPKVKKSPSGKKTAAGKDTAAGRKSPAGGKSPAGKRSPANRESPSRRPPGGQLPGGRPPGGQPTGRQPPGGRPPGGQPRGGRPPGDQPGSKRGRRP